MTDAGQRESEHLIARGNRHFRERRFELASQAFVEFLRRHPGDRKVLYNLSRALLAQGRTLFKHKNYGAAIKVMKSSLEAWPGDADALSSLGTACRKAARYDQARDSYRACLQAGARTGRSYEFFYYVYCGALVDGAQAIPNLLAAVEPSPEAVPVRDFWRGIHAYNLAIRMTASC